MATSDNNNLPLEFSCAFCLGKLEKPVSYAVCQHRMCFGCFTTALLDNINTCPQCNASFTNGGRSGQPDKALEARIKARDAPATSSGDKKRKSSDTNTPISQSEKKQRKSVEPVTEVDENAKLREMVAQLRMEVEKNARLLEEQKLRNDTLQKSIESESTKKTKLVDVKPTCATLYSLHQLMEADRKRLEVSDGKLAEDEDNDKLKREHEHLKKKYEATKSIYVSAVETFSEYAQEAHRFFKLKEKAREEKKNSKKKSESSKKKAIQEVEEEANKILEEEANKILDDSE